MLYIIILYIIIVFVYDDVVLIVKYMCTNKH